MDTARFPFAVLVALILALVTRSTARGNDDAKSGLSALRRESRTVKPGVTRAAQLSPLCYRAAFNTDPFRYIKTLLPITVLHLP